MTLKSKSWKLFFSLSSKVSNLFEFLNPKQSIKPLFKISFTFQNLKILGCDTGWDKKDSDLIARGIILATQQLPGRARNWFYGHGENVDEQTGESPPPIVKPKDKLVKAIQEVQEGKFIPDGEKDVLAKALGNAELTGRTRGLGHNYPWSIGFAEDVDSYRKWERGKKRKEEEEEEEEKEWLKKME
jgi:hypothetical protein